MGLSVLGVQANPTDWVLVAARSEPLALYERDWAPRPFGEQAKQKGARAQPPRVEQALRLISLTEQEAALLAQLLLRVSTSKV